MLRLNVGYSADLRLGNLGQAETLRVQVDDFSGTPQLHSLYAI